MIEEEEQQPQVIQQQQSAPAPVMPDPATTVAQIFPEYNHEETESIISNSEESEYVDNYRKDVLKKVNDEIMQDEEDKSHGVPAQQPGRSMVSSSLTRSQVHQA